MNEKAVRVCVCGRDREKEKEDEKEIEWTTHVPVVLSMYSIMTVCSIFDRKTKSTPAIRI